MDNCTLQDLEEMGFSKIGEIGEDGQGCFAIMAKKIKGAWSYMLVEVTDDGEVIGVTGLANGKVFNGD